ncbi:MAG: hypothetical protein D6752_06060 [Candidatus Nitrosothermus koennekii]|nr:MAG: hypothetical protein D6752_06060 [Candidatus Nitrosothermus koennekii]
MNYVLIILKLVHFVRVIRNSIIGEEDYAFIGFVNQNDIKILIVWGLTYYGTSAALQLLQHYDTIYDGVLDGKAMIIKWEDTDDNDIVDINDSITSIEVWSSI